jgi:sugar O-acyltransferase (sialic acid O-acetyltransferase NeuD family)
MTSNAVIIIGAGGHAVVVADALIAAGRRLLGFVDEDPSKIGQRLLDRPVLGGESVLLNYRAASIELANGIGGTGASVTRGLRERVQSRLEGNGWRFTSVRHPSAIVAPDAHLGPGCQVLAGGIVQTLASLGRGSIVNTGAVVEHNAHVGDFAHIGPGAVLCGGVRVGVSAHVGAGATIKQGITLGDGVVVGIGAAVVHDCAAGLLIGVPARVTVSS